MLKTSSISLTQSLIDLADNEYDGGDYDKNEAKIVLASSMFKDPTKADYLIFGTKKTFNFLQHMSTEAFIH